MAQNEAHVRDFARSYTEAWCTHDPAIVASHYVPGGTIAINGGEPTDVTEVARAFITAFPDIEVLMDDVVVQGETVIYHWDVHRNEHRARRDREGGSHLRQRGVDVRRGRPRRDVAGLLRPGRVRSRKLEHGLSL